MGSHNNVSSRRPAGFLTRLRRDCSGNTLAIVGAALIPLTAMIGSGVDLSRAYMAQTRLQSACDAAALAGRRIMSGDTLTPAVTAEANRFFNFNFAQNLYQTAAFTPVVTRPSTGTVRVTAATTIPTAVMHMFGFENLSLSVTCDASLSFVNTDVMLVLDVTGSMRDPINGTPKIVSLREAVMALYNTLAPTQVQLEAAGLRLRYGIVPYSSTVNVGRLLYNLDADYLARNAEYSTRVANMNTPVHVGTPGTPKPAETEEYDRSISQSDCDRYGRNVSFPGFGGSPASGGTAPAPTWSRTFSNNEASGVDWGWRGSDDRNGGERSCRRRYIETDTTYVTEYRFTNWSFSGESVNVSTFRNPASSVSIADFDLDEQPTGRVPRAGPYDMRELEADGTDVPSTTSRWNGCIEERQTLPTITPSANLTIPSDAYDLNINLIPYDDDTRWRPMWGDITYRRTAGVTSQTVINDDVQRMSEAACPAAARTLEAMSQSGMQTFVNGLQPTGSTYHDIGMIWGARMISSGGVFADSPDEFNGMPVSRHIIFMTDGQMDTANNIYAFHGIERNDQRVSGMSNPSEAELNNRHMQRFSMICNAAKANNTQIWVIAFGTTVSAPMQACASNANQASTASNRDQLIARFAEIGRNIGALRLTQ